MSDPAAQPAGVLDSVKRIGASVISLLQNRLQLFALELQDEKLRLVDTLIWLCLGVILAMAGLLVGLTTLAIFLWETTGYTGLIVMAAALLLTGLGVLWRLRERLRQGPPPFADTVAEFKKDCACLQKKD